MYHHSSFNPVLTRLSIEFSHSYLPIPFHSRQGVNIWNVMLVGALAPSARPNLSYLSHLRRSWRCSSSSRYHEVNKKEVSRIVPSWLNYTVKQKLFQIRKEPFAGLSYLLTQVYLDVIHRDLTCVRSFRRKSNYSCESLIMNKTSKSLTVLRPTQTLSAL